jgi:beta-lactamase class A
MHCSLLSVLLMFVLSYPSIAVSADDSTFVREIRRLEAEFGGHLGVMAKDLGSGQTAGYNATERFPTASVIKFPIMAAFFDRVARGLVDPAMPVFVQSEDKKPGSGVLQFLSDSTRITLQDAVKLMIILSDNSATNLVLDRLAPDHDSRMAAVNDVMTRNGLENTRLLNRLFSWQTKKSTPEAIRYGIGVSTPEDMVMLLEKLHARALVDSASSEAMIKIMKDQQDQGMIPRLLPSHTCRYLSVAHKTGWVNESKVDVGLVLSDRVNLAIAVFVDKQPDHEEGVNNTGVLLAARAARAAWNHFTGDSGYERVVNEQDVDWNQFPGGRWAIYRSPYAPFPHPAREQGFRGSDGTFYPPFPHYSDNSIVVFVPEGFTETADGVNVIVHFHGHANDNMGVLEQFGMPQAMISTRTNALLVLPQGPYRARDSFGGKMEDEGGFRRMVEDVLETMKKEGVITATRIRDIVVTAHSGGYRPTAYVLDNGGLTSKISHVFLFDAFYAEHEKFEKWLAGGHGVLYGAYTDHLKDEHLSFEARLKKSAGDRIHFEGTHVDHNAVVNEYFPRWLMELDSGWRLRGSP